MQAGNAHGDAGDRTGHAERLLMTKASMIYSADFLAGCTMYASAEPCAMCAGAVYWAGVGRVVYGLSERDLGQLIGPHPENLTMDLPCRTVFGAGQRKVEVVGPLLEAESRAVHDGFWR
jgi:tRNA(Arg) A34 adenosine deaminase TadA